MRIVGSGGHASVVREVIDLNGAHQYVADWCFIAVGDNAARKREVKAHSPAVFPTLIHPRAIVSPLASVGAGSIVMAGAVVQPHARIGQHCIVNSGATVDHHAILGDYVHIAPGAHLCGNVHVGEGTLVGVGVGIAPGTKIPSWSLVKARGIKIEPVAIGR